MSRSRSRSIPKRSTSPSQSILASSFQPSSFLAQEAINADLDAAEEDNSTFDDSASDISQNQHATAEHTMYRRPSVGVAYGTTRPTVGPRPVDDVLGGAGLVGLTHEEWVRSQDEERSLLRDNHLLPPKHLPVIPPEEESWARRAYKAMFSTKVPLKDEDDEGDGASLARVVSERAPLLAGNGHGNGNGYDGTADEEAPLVVGAELAEQWEAAVSAGQIKTTWQREAKTIAVYSRSLIVTFLLQYSINVASIFTVGRIGVVELGAISRECCPLPPSSLLHSRNTMN